MPLDESVANSGFRLIASVRSNARLVSMEAVEFEDARSAAFFAMGEAVKEQEPVLLVVPGEYLESTYTAVTEAWFQKAPLVVLAVHSNVRDVKTSWMDCCVAYASTFGVEYLEEELFKAKAPLGPVLLNLVDYESQKEDGVSYGDASRLLCELDKNAKAMIYNPEPESIVAGRCEVVSSADKYGLLSRYIGRSVVGDAGYLICTTECVLVDSNVFRTRYVNKSMKIVVLDDGRLIENGLCKWIESNGWSLHLSGADIREGMRWIVDQSSPSVLIVKA